MRITENEWPQDYAGLRADHYPPNGEQNGAFAKLVTIMLRFMPPEAMAAIEAEAPDALEVLDLVEATKRQLPKPQGKPKE